MKRIVSISGLALSIAVLLSSCATSPEKGARTVELFNGKDLKDWQFILADPNVQMDQVWSVQDGILVCKGEPIGALYKGPNVTNFRLIVEYRWVPGTTPGNSGIFSRMTTPPLKPLPQAVEIQLKHGNAGDVIGLQGRKIARDQPRFFEAKAHPLAGDIAGVRKLSEAEKLPGEWNRVEILAEGANYTVWMNERLVNQVQGVEIVSGPVGIQSEGGEIEFRRVDLRVLD